MSEPIEHTAAESGPWPNRAAGQQLVIGILEDVCPATLALEELRMAGFTPGECTIVASVRDARHGLSGATARLDPLTEASVVDCRGLGTLLIGGGAIASLRALGVRTSLPELGRAFADAGLPDADALIYALSLVRGQCLLAVRAATAERGQVAYRLLLRCGSPEVHAYRA